MDGASACRPVTVALVWLAAGGDGDDPGGFAAVPVVPAVAGGLVLAPKRRDEDCPGLGSSLEGEDLF